MPEQGHRTRPDAAPTAATRWPQVAERIPRMWRNTTPEGKAEAAQWATPIAAAQRWPDAPADTGLGLCRSAMADLVVALDAADDDRDSQAVLAAQWIDEVPAAVLAWLRAWTHGPAPKPTAVANLAITVLAAATEDVNAWHRGRPEACPDKGTCHHQCPEGGACWRVLNAGPLGAAKYPDDRWPDDIVDLHLGLALAQGAPGDRVARALADALTASPLSAAAEALASGKVRIELHTSDPAPAAGTVTSGEGYARQPTDTQWSEVTIRQPLSAAELLDAAARAWVEEHTEEVERWREETGGNPYAGSNPWMAAAQAAFVAALPEPGRRSGRRPANIPWPRIDCPDCGRSIAYSPAARRLQSHDSPAGQRCPSSDQRISEDAG